MGLLRGLAELVVPPACFSCGARSYTPLCAGCVSAIETIEEPVCPICGRPTVHDVAMCSGCRAHRPTFDCARAYAVYDFPIKDAVIGLKSKQGRGLAEFLAPRLTEAFHSAIAGADAVTFVPISPGRLLKRGFNQAEELANAVSVCSGTPAINALKMTRAVKDQGQLPPAKRAANVAGAFALKSRSPHFVADISKRRIILVDDVITTGATVSACSFVLKEAGAADVTVLTLARAVRLF